MPRAWRNTLAGVAASGLFAAAPAAAAADETLLVRFRAGTSPAEAAAALARAGAEREGSIRRLGVQEASVPGAAAADILAALRASGDVLFAEPDGLVRMAGTPTGDPVSDANSWPFSTTRLSAAWELSRGDPAVTVAVVDTGVSPHEDLPPLTAGWDTLNGDADPSDDNGHGTAVAGILAAVTGNGLGTAGVCPGCTLMPVKALGHDGYGTWSAVAAGIVWAVDHGADVVNLSLGAPAASQTVALAVDYARAHGATVVAAAGNAGSTTPYYPADFPGVLGVAASDGADALYGFSNRGSWVEVAAPGCASSLKLGGGYRDFCGTSTAAPFVAGLAALARSFAPAAPSSQLESAILATARPLPEVVSGRIDAHAALEALGAPGVAAPQSVTPPRIVGRLGLRRTLRVVPGTWSGDGPFSLSYRWLRCSRKACATVSTRQTHRLRRADRGRRLRVVVAASNPAGTATARSLAIRVPRRLPARIVPAN